MIVGKGAAYADAADEVREFIDRARDRARAILSADRDTLDRLAARLVEVETLEGAELRALLQGEEGANATPPPAPRSDAPGRDDDRPREPLMPPKPGLVLGGSVNYGIDADRAPGGTRVIRPVTAAHKGAR